MATRHIETVVKLTGEDDYKKALKSINGELKTLGSESKLIQAEFKGQANSMEALEAKHKNLKNQIEVQADAVKELEEVLQKSKNAYGDHAKETQQWQQKLNRAKANLLDLDRELQDNEKYMDEARRSTDGCATSIDKFGKEVKQTESEIDTFEGVIKALIGGDGGQGLAGLKSMLAKGLAVGTIVTALKETAGAVTEVVDSTKEYRTIMGSLEVSSERAGYTAKQTEEAYIRLYAVLGDSQTAATATANLQALNLSQGELMELVDATIGAWSTYGDSIPVDGLAEAVNETIRCGEVTGVFADVLNWGSKEGETFGIAMRESTKANEEWNKKVAECQTAEDYFNLALSECSTQAERQNLLMNTLAHGGLAEAGREWRNVNEDVVANNESMARYEEAMGRLGTALSPVADFLRNTLAVSIGWVADALERGIDLAGKFIEKLQESNTATSKAQDAGLFSGIDDSCANGLYRVPFDGYIVETHKDEMIVPAAQADVLRRYFSSGVSALQTAEQYHTARSESDTGGGTEVINITVQSVLNDRVIGESVTTYQRNKGRASGR